MERRNKRVCMHGITRKVAWEVEADGFLESERERVRFLGGEN